jgi:hypothetical protein
VANQIFLPDGVDPTTGQQTLRSSVSPINPGVRQQFTQQVTPAATPQVTAPSAAAVTGQQVPVTWQYAVNLATDPNWKQMAQQGIGVVVAEDDPNASALVAAAKAHGVPVAVNVAALNGETPEAYAARITAARDKWQPDKIVADIEFPGKGYAPTDPNYNPQYQGWQWSQEAAPLIAQAAGGTSLTVTMMPNQTDFNYQAYNNIGADFWVQTYGANPATDQRDPTQVVNQVIAQGVAPSKVTALVAPGQQVRGLQSVAVYGITGNTPAPDPNAAASQPVDLSTADFGSSPQDFPTKTTTAPPLQGPATGWNTGSTSTSSGSTGGGAAGGSTTGSSTTPPAGPDWAQTYFGSMGLPADVIQKVDDIFRQYDDPQTAAQFALAYIRGTPWYATTYPGIKEGISKGVIGNEQDYRGYLNQVNQLAQRYLGRAISSAELGSYLTQGLSVDTIGRQYAGLADVMANYKDYRYYLGAFGDTEDQKPSTDDMRAYGEEKNGLDSALGQHVSRAMSIALQRYQKLFSGDLATPSLTLQNGRLSAPSLSGPPPDIAA